MKYSSYIKSVEVTSEVIDTPIGGMTVRFPSREPTVKVCLEIPYSHINNSDGRWFREQVETFVDRKFELPEELFKL